MITLHITFVRASATEDYWLADEDELDAGLKRIMPDVKKYSTRGFVDYKGHQIEKIFRCYNNEIPGKPDGKNVILLNVIPKNL
jgi:hypothetical protein